MSCRTQHSTAHVGTATVHLDDPLGKLFTMQQKGILKAILSPAVRCIRLDPHTHLAHVLVICLLWVWPIQGDLPHQSADIKVVQHFCLPYPEAEDQTPPEPVMQVCHVLHGRDQFLQLAVPLQRHVGIDVRWVADVAEELAEGTEANLEFQGCFAKQHRHLDHSQVWAAGTPTAAAAKLG
jgi:hypothetical protein